MSTEYTIKKVKIDASSIEDLKKMKHARAISNGHVTKLYKALKEQYGFDQPFVVNQKGNDYILIDGNHRFEAFKKWIEEDKENSAIQDFYIYDNLTREEEADVYTQWNSGKKQSSNDFVFLHQDWIPMLKMVDNFPVKLSMYNLSKNRQGVELSTLTKAWFFATRPTSDNKIKQYRTSQKQFVEDLKTLTKSDVQVMAHFVEFFERIFGKMEYDNRYQTTTGLNVLMALYMRNVPRIPEAKLADRLLKRIWNKGEFMEMAASGGTKATEALYHRTLSILNEGVADDKKLI